MKRWVLITLVGSSIAWPFASTLGGDWLQENNQPRMVQLEPRPDRDAAGGGYSGGPDYGGVYPVYPAPGPYPAPVYPVPGPYPGPDYGGGYQGEPGYGGVYPAPGPYPRANEQRR